MSYRDSSGQHLIVREAIAEHVFRLMDSTNAELLIKVWMVWGPARFPIMSCCHASQLPFPFLFTLPGPHFQGCGIILRVVKSRQPLLQARGAWAWAKQHIFKAHGWSSGRFNPHILCCSTQQQ